MRTISIREMAEVEISSSERDILISRLQLRSKFTEELITLYREAGGDSSRLFIPRGLITGDADHKEWPELTCRFTGTLREKQESISYHILNHLEKFNGGIVRADTGTGKTVVGIDVAIKLGYKTLIIVPTSYLLHQWRSRILSFTDCTNTGIIVQNTCDYRDHDFTIGMIHSLSKEDKYPEDIYSYFGLIIWDEVHRLGAPTFAETACKFWSDVRLGLSATPRRKDGFENVFKYHIGKEIPFNITQHLKPKVIVIRYLGSDASSSRCTFNGKLSIGMYATQLVNLHQRNDILAAAIKNAFNNPVRRILMLTDRVGQIHAVKDLLQHKYSVPSGNIGIFTGDVKVGIDTRRIILATYGSAGLGADLPGMNTLVLGTPRADIEQAVGRILRNPTGVEPIVVDIVDYASPIMRKWYGCRRSFYAAKGSEIVER